MGNQCTIAAVQNRNKDHVPDVKKDWIASNLKRKKCQTSIIDTNNKEKCMCGENIENHRKKNVNVETGRKWTTEKDTKKYPTNAYGEMVFNGFGEFRSKSKYVRVSEDTDMKTMFELMTVHWGLGEPKLLLSVTGSAKDYNWAPYETKLFKQGLMRAAVSAGAWIITGGSNEGVMKHIGEAVHDYQLTKKRTSNDVVAIGIGTWGCIMNRNALKRKHHDEHGKALYKRKNKPPDKRTYLNPDYTHFILVDDGTRDQWGKEIAFRGKLQREVSSTLMANTRKSEKDENQTKDQKPIRTDAMKIPVVTILVQGGQRSLRTVLQSVKDEIPVVVIEGSGEVSDMIVEAYKSAGNNAGKMSQDVEERVKKKLKEKFEKKKDNEALVNEHFVYLQEIISKPHLVSTHRLESFQNKGLDLTILEALVKANEDHRINELNLALHWNRIDFVKKRKKKLTEEDLKDAVPDLMMSALKLNRAEFVDMFISNGIQMREFLTKDRLKSLYLDVDCHSSVFNFHKKLKNPKWTTAVFFEKLRELLQPIIKIDYNPIPNKDDPCQDMFIWSIVMNRMEMAKVWWRQIKKNPIAAALVASALFNNMAEKCNDDVLLKDLKKNSVEFSRLAIDMANMCYEEDENKAHQLLHQKLDGWGEVACLELAAETENKHFLSQTTCKTYLHRLWMGNLSYTMKYKALILPICALWPFLILTCVDFNSHFQSKENFMKEKSAKNKKWWRLDCCARLAYYFRRFGAFYLSPIVKFLLHVVSYVAFLIYFSLILLVEFDSTIRKYDVVLFIWVLSIFVEEMIQLARTHECCGMCFQNSCCGHDSSYKRSRRICKPQMLIWTIVNVAAFLLFLIGMVVRFANPEESINVARVFLGLDLMLYYFKSIHILSASKNLGPKIVMIAQMFVDLLYFLVILMIFVLAYAIASYSILYPNSLLNGDLLMKVGRSAYWNLYGEISVDELDMKEPECTFNPSLYENGTLPRCATEIGSYVVPILMGIYVMFSNILLLNLLIAMFSNTFNRIQAKADLLWNYQRYYLVYEYLYLSPFPSPVVLLYHIYLFCRCIVHMCPCVKKADDKNMDIGNIRSHFDRYNKGNKKKRLQLWERILADNYIDKGINQQEKQRCGTDGDEEFEISALSKRVHFLVEQQLAKISTASAKQNTEQTARNLHQTDAESDARDTKKSGFAIDIASLDDIEVVQTEFAQPKS